MDVWLLTKSDFESTQVISVHSTKANAYRQMLRARCARWQECQREFDAEMAAAIHSIYQYHVKQMPVDSPSGEGE